MSTSMKFYRWQHWWCLQLNFSLTWFSVVCSLVCFWSLLRVKYDIALRWGQNSIVFVRLFARWIYGLFLLNKLICSALVDSVLVTEGRQLAKLVSYSLHESALWESVNWPCWSSNLAAEISGPDPIWLIFMDSYERGCLQDQIIEENGTLA
jgi:hypothetical protein